MLLVLRFVGHTFLSDSELELTFLTFELPFAPGKWTLKIDVVD